MMRMRSQSVRILMVASSMALAACGSVSASNDGGGPPTVQQACGAFAQALCTRLDSCAPFIFQIFYGTAATCRERVELSCTKDLEVPETNQTTTEMAACATAANSATCDDLLADNFPEPCRIKAGPRLNGEGCGSSWQCMSTHCEKTTGDCGTCAPRQAANGACTVNEGCTLGLVCTNGKCVSPSPLGGSCDANTPCRGGNMYCNVNMCATRLGAGSSCEGNSEACDFGRGVGCNVLSATPTCQPVASAQGGQPCGIVNGTLTICQLVNECAGATLMQAGACVAPSQDGTACSMGHNCLPPANCIGGICRLPSAGSCPK
jgi:hypothetical protein